MIIKRDDIEYIRLTSEELLSEKLDPSIDEFRAVPALLKAGDLAGAEHVFAEYVRSNLKPRLFFTMPFPPYENQWREKSESDRAVFERLLHGEIMSVGFMHDFGDGGIQWESNPMPSKYKEWPWQLNRHHEFIALAKLYLETGDEAIPELFLRLWRSWREQCYCPLNRHGTSSWSYRTIEIGIRMKYSWHCALHAFYRSPAFTDHDICDFFGAVWENSQRLVRQHMYTGNWLMMEMSGLFTAGVLYPWMSDSGMWKKYALDKIREQIEKQVYPDGFQIELSTGYHSAVIGNTLGAVRIARTMGETVDRELIDMLAPAYDMYVKLSDPEMYAPGLNDAGYSDVRRSCQGALVQFPDREDYRFFATERREGKPPEYINTLMPYSGMVVFRDDWTSKSQWLFFESAPFGLQHQHEDKLSVLLYAFGKRMLKDTGNHVYDSSLMRKFVLSTRGHNTVLVDGLDQNRRGRYCWHDEDRLKLSDLKVWFGTDTDVAFGIYNEGYGPDYIDVTHNRTVVKVKKSIEGLDTFYLVIDRLTAGDGRAHAYAAHWQLEDVPLSVKAAQPVGYGRRGDISDDYQEPGRRGCVANADYGDGVTLTMISGENYTVRAGSIDPFMGWRKPDIPAPSIDFTVFGESSRIVTLLYPSDHGCSVMNIEYQPDVDRRDILIRLKDGREWIFNEPLDE